MERCGDSLTFDLLFAVVVEPRRPILARWRTGEEYYDFPNLLTAVAFLAAPLKLPLPPSY